MCGRRGALTRRCDHPADQAKAVGAVLLAGVEQHLHPDADAEQRHVEGLQGRRRSRRCECHPSRSAVVPDARQYDTRRAVESLRVRSTTTTSAPARSRPRAIETRFPAPWSTTATRAVTAHPWSTRGRRDAASIATADPHGTGERLECGFCDVVIVGSRGGDMECDAGRTRERLQRVGDVLGRQASRASVGRTAGRTPSNGRPEMSTTAVARASSIGTVASPNRVRCRHDHRAPRRRLHRVPGQCPRRCGGRRCGCHRSSGLRRSNIAWCPNAVSRWSKNPSPVVTDDRPEPSSSRSIVDSRFFGLPCYRGRSRHRCSSSSLICAARR